MARTLLNAQKTSKAGLNAAYQAAIADGHMFANDGRQLLHVKNSDVADRTLTFPTPATQDGLAIADQAVTVPAGGEQFIGPFPGRTFNQSGVDAGRVHIDYSAVTGVTVAVIEPGV
jgi:hypothetical protein